MCTKWLKRSIWSDAALIIRLLCFFTATMLFLKPINTTTLWFPHKKKQYKSPIEKNLKVTEWLSWAIIWLLSFTIHTNPSSVLVSPDSVVRASYMKPSSFYWYRCWVSVSDNRYRQHRQRQTDLWKNNDLNKARDSKGLKKQSYNTTNDWGLVYKFKGKSIFRGIRNKYVNINTNNWTLFFFIFILILQFMSQ